MNMFTRSALAASAVAIMCLAAAPTDGAIGVGRAIPRGPESTGAATLGVLVPATTTGGEAPAPTLVFLHGICGEPRNGCAAFAGLGRGDLVCARADMACPAGGAMWSGGQAALARIEDAVRQSAREGRFDVGDPRVLVGFSQGAYVALRAARAAPKRYTSMLLIGAFVRPTRHELEQAGIGRIVLAAGDLDGAARTMRESTERLRAEGFDARYVSLGRVGHTYVPDDRSKLALAVEWASSGAMM